MEDEKFALINVGRIKAWLFDRKVNKLIKKANEFSKLRREKFMVVFIAGKLGLYKKKQLRKLVKMRVFAKGITIQQIEKSALYVTK